MALEEFDQSIYAGGIRRVNGDVVPTKTSLWLRAIGLVKGRRFVDEAAGESRTGFDGREARFDVVVNASAQAQQRAVCAFNQHPGTSTATLFIGHANGAVVHGVGIAIARVQEIKRLAGVVQFAARIKFGRCCLANFHLEFSLPIGDGLMVGLCCRGEVVGRVVAHLVVIAMHMRHPRVVQGRSRLRFLLFLPRPIPVQVEQVVVRTSTGPGLIVLHAVRIGIGRETGMLIEPNSVPVVAIWVEARIHQHH